MKDIFKTIWSSIGSFANGIVSGFFSLLRWIVALIMIIIVLLAIQTGILLM